MADKLTSLCHFIFDEKPSPSDLIPRLRSDDSIKQGLEHFFFILKKGVVRVGDGDKLGFQSWSYSQIQSVVSLAHAIAHLSRSLSVDQVEPIVVAVMHRLLEFGVSYLEKSDFTSDDLSTQCTMITALEVALVDGMEKSTDILQPSSANSIGDLLVEVSGNCGDVELDNIITCTLQEGARCMKEEKPVDRLLMMLTSECLESDCQAFGLGEPPLQQEMGKLVSLSQHLAVIHIECIWRLILICRKLIDLPETFDEKTSNISSCRRLSLSLRLLKLLGNLAKGVQYIENDASLLQSVASFADAIPKLFKLKFDFANHATADGSFENLALLLLEEFLHLVQGIFCNSSVFLNIEACIVASVTRNFDSSVWRYDVLSSNIKPPLAYFPRTVISFLKLIQDLKKQTYHTHDLSEFENGLSGSSVDVLVETASCHVHNDSVPLLKRLTVDELFGLIFPSSSPWVDHLLDLSYFLYREGVKVRPKVERSQSSSGKVNNYAEVESQSCHEDEALFGNLFSEGSRSLSSTDVYDQPPPAVCSSSSDCNLPIQAATEVMSFLKSCIFFNEWLPSMYEDGCKKLDESHIDVLLAIIGSQGCFVEDLTSDSSALHEERKIRSFQGLCFGLMCNLLTWHALSGSLEEYLVERILRTENGNFVYSDLTLTLLARTLLCRRGVTGAHLRIKVYNLFVSFIAEKAKNILSLAPSFKDLLLTLPSVFHVEILIMAFHLSSQGEKIKLANLVLASIQKINVPSVSSGSMQLSSWALLVSRLIILLRHMMCHPRTCPASLLLDLRTKLREIPSSGYILSDNVSNHLSSWVSITMRDLFSTLIEDEVIISRLMNQLIDAAAFPLALCNDVDAFETLSLRWGDVCAALSGFLGFWKGRKAAEVVDLIVERYFFVLCWDLHSVGSALDQQLSSQATDLSNMVQFFHFSHSLMCHSDVIGRGSECQNVLLGVLSSLCAFPTPLGIEELGWDFLRSGSWLSLVLFFLNAGISGHCKEDTLSGFNSCTTKNTSKDNAYVTAAESHISYLIDTGEVTSLLRTLSSLLNRYLLAYQKAFVATISITQNHADKFSSLLLLTHSGFERSLQNEVLEKHGTSHLQMESILDLSKLDSAVDKRASGILSKAFMEVMMHGFPSHLMTPNGILVSCVLSLREIISTINGLLKLEKVRGHVCLETEVLNEILNSVMIVKSDRNFESLHIRCEEIYKNICAQLELPDCAELFVMKQMEGYLRDIDGKGLGDSSIHAWVITKLLDSMDALKRDPLKSFIFKFYLGAEDTREEAKDRNQLPRGDLLVLIDSIECCYSESVNTKVLNFFVDVISGELCPDLRKKVQKRFLDMDLSTLSKWLEKRLLGVMVEEPEGVKYAKGNSVIFRELTMNFITCLISSPTHLQSIELHRHIFEALLSSLDTAFLAFDINVAKSYYHFVVQLSREENLIKMLLERTIVLTEKLAGDECLLPGLRFLFGFLGTVLTDCEFVKNNIDKSYGKCLSIKSSSAVTAAPRSSASRMNSETLVFSANQEGGSMSLECDVTSLDEDEDDGTSDGEVASLDKDEEEDTSSERALASKVCTFTSSGSNFMEQHWYFCYTCDLTVSKGCCSVCAKVCHNGHRVVYSRSSRFFCDCGAGGVRGSSCQCLKPRKFTGTDGAPARGASTFQSFLPFTQDADQLPESDSDLDDDIITDTDNSFRLSLPRELQDKMPMLLKELDVESRVLELCSSLLPSITSKRESNLSKDKRVSLGKDKVLSLSVDLLQLKKAYKSGSLDLKIKADYANAKELKSLLASGSLVKSLLSVSARGRLAVGEGDKVAIFDVGQIIGQASVAPVTADKANVKPLSRNIVRFEIVHLAFNPVVENYLAVAGFEDCQVLTVNPRGEVTDRLAIELSLQGAYIRRIDWVPGSQVQLMLVTNKFVKIYDLSQDNISPTHYFTLPNDTIVDATLCVASHGKLFLLVLSEQGNLLRFELALEGNVGATPLKETIHLKDKEINAKGSSLYFSSTYRILFVSYQDGTSLMGRLSPDAASLTEISCICEEEPNGQVRPAGLHRWKTLLAGSGLFVSFSSVRSNTAVAVAIGGDELLAQNLRHPVGSTTSLVGLTAYKPLSKDKVHCLALHDDGSLQIYSHMPLGLDVGSSVTAEKVKKLGTDILSNKAYAGTKPDFPLDFFEKTVCITADVKLGGDAIRNGDFEGAKQSLASEDGFLESPNPAGFKISVSNPNPDTVMVGIRVHVGNTSANHIPSEVIIFQRVIKFDEGMRSWYDVPFTVAESLLADEEFVISVGPTFNGKALPRLDSLEVYGRAKDEFGWKEKMDAVLDMEARVLGCKSLLVGSRKKGRSLHSASIQEQVVADGLKLLSLLYSLCRSQQNEVKDLSKLKCRQLLETIFESDREPLVQAAACHVLQAVYTKKEMYYQAKDTMRLLGVVKATSALSLRLGVGSTGGWVIEEFNAQMRALSRIALSRQSNLSFFLEMNGSQVVDGLMHVLWGILELEQPDTQTMNNIVMSSVELIYSYAECLASRGNDTCGSSVAPAVTLMKKLMFFPNEAVQTSSSLAISSRLLQVPFPKQTMLAADDVVENVASSSVPVRTAGGNTQVMIEEDSITSSVQYCCDGCSTVPILRRRWHCTVCPDFDLCEACYEVLDADRLPPPHSRDHPMRAVPVEVESFGGDGNEIHFSTDDADDSNVLPVTTDSRSIRSSAPSIHVLEPDESENFAAPVTDPVSISAAKRAVNSLILSELLEQLKGWMDTTSGVRAIPVMQLFYRLSSAVGGPFMDSSKPEHIDLEKLIQWLLNEINPNKPFIVKARSFFGEVAIVVFMFFTLMLRNWHQPGNDSATSKASGKTESQDKRISQNSTSVASRTALDDQERNEFASQLLRACICLRNQAFVSYLMDILQQLLQVFKSPAVNLESVHGLNSGSGCGALLTVRRDLPSGNFSPFFSDSYAKAHRRDIFMDYHRLLLENVFRLVYTLVRPEKQDKSGEKEKVHKMSSTKELKLDGYQDVLCSYINNPHTTFIRRYARRLFLHLCGSKTQYYSVRDTWQFSNEVKKLYKHVNKSGGFQNLLPYERSVKIVKCLSAMAEVASARPRNWQKYCLKHGDVLPFMLNGIFYFGEESVILTLKLLNFGFYSGKDVSQSLQKAETGDLTSSKKSAIQSLDSKKKKKGENGNDPSSEKSYLDMEAAVDIFSDKGAQVLRQFIDFFLLEWNSSSVRVEAKCVLFGLWHHGKASFKEIMLTAFLEKVKSLPMYGLNIAEYTELLTWLLEKAPHNISKQHSSELVDRCLLPDVIKCIFETLQCQNELIANHPNSRIYSTLSGLVEFDGYYLESEPCVACSSPEVPYSRMKLESLKSETKFTDNRIIVKCTGSYTIQSLSMNVHDARKSKSVKVLNLYYNNRPVSDLSELKNNWSLWKRAKSCHLAFNQTELKVEFPIPITACNFMIELDSFYENLQALSLEPLQCPRCSRPVIDKHGICGNCHENAYQCRQCRNINYENLDSFLCNECGYSKYGRFEFNFMAKPSYTFDNMENDDDMKRGLAAIESESENAHRRYQQLLGFKKPLLKIVSSIGESDMDSQQKDSVQQMMVSLPGPTCKINRKIALLGVLYGEKCKAAFDSVSKSVQTLQGLRRVLMSYLHQKNTDKSVASPFVVSRSPNNCYGCATTFVTQCLEILQVLSKHPSSKKQLVSAGILSELFENNIHQGAKSARIQARAVLSAFSEGDVSAVTELNSLIQKKVMYCLEHHRSMDIAVTTREELLLLSEVCSLADDLWESRLRVVFQLLFSSIKLGAKHPAISEHVILPCLRIISQACTPPKPDVADKDQDAEKSTSGTQSRDANNNSTSGVSGTKDVLEPSEKNWDVVDKAKDIQLVSYSEWEKGATYLDFVRRQYKVYQVVKGTSHRSRTHRADYLALKYALRWKRRASRKAAKGGIQAFEQGSWVTELVLCPCSHSIRSEMCMLISLLFAQSSTRRFRLLTLLMGLLPDTLAAGESATEYFELLYKMIDSEEACLFLTVRGCLTTICKLITQEVGNIESLEKSLHIDISQGFILHKLIELLGKFLVVPNIRSRFMRDNLLSEVLEALIVIRGLVVQKTKLINDCNRLLNDLLDSLLLESSENKRQFIRACIYGLQNHGEEKKERTCLFILEQLCNLICPSKPEAVYMLILNKAHTQEEFIRGSMTKNPYSSAEIGPLMRDVKNKICQQLDLLGLVEDDFGMELLVAGNIISLDLSISLVYEQVWKKSNSQSSGSLTNSALLSSNVTSSRDCPPMTVTYRLQGLDGEATEPMIKELEEDREESQDPEVEFAIAGAVREYGGLEILLTMIKRLRDDFKSNQEQLVAVLNLLMNCCKTRENRRALLRLGASSLLLETARRAFSVDAMEPAEGILLIVESLTLEANESDSLSISQNVLTVTSEEAGTDEQAKKIVLMFLERLSHPSGLKKSNKQQRNTEMVARILPYLTYGEPAAMEALIQHFNPYLQDWCDFDHLQKQHQENPKDETIVQEATRQRMMVENFVRVSESLKTSSCGERIKDIILTEGIIEVAVNHLKESFVVTGQAGFRSSIEWLSALKLPSIPLILSMLHGLSMGHLATQRCIDEGGVLSLLHLLEGVPGENEIGARAENLLDTLSDKDGKGDGFLGEKISALRHATKDEMRRRALIRRQEMLQGLGMRQELASDGAERIVVARPILEGLEDVEEEEDGLACMVCREGYSLRPTDLLGVYSFSKRVNLGVGTSGSARGECVYTTVSYFNIIHFQCHQEAKRADAALKTPKKEWDGATLRNNESLCNSLFPVRGPSVPPAQYVRYVDQYWDNLNALGRADGSRLRLLTYDIVLMLARFATGASFSAESRGGGRESNSRFLPFMIQMGRHLLDHGSPTQQRTMAKSVLTYINSSTVDNRPGGAQQPSAGTEETVQLMMVNSLLAESYDSWLHHRRAFLQRGIYHAYMQHTHGRSTPRGGIAKVDTESTSRSQATQSDGDDLLSIIRPMLVYTGLIEQLQHFFKVKKPASKGEGTTTVIGEEESGNLEGWEVVMKERLLNVKELLGFSKELLSWLDDMNSAMDLQEAFDTVGVLADVLSGGGTCQDFVQAAINAGKS